VNLEVHLCLSMQALEISLELALVGANGFTKSFIVLKDGSETERKDGGVFEAVSDDPGVIDAGLLIESFGGIVLADDDCQITCGVEEDLVATDSKYGFKWDWFAMAG
jgi:hypothetical protein